MTIKDFLQNNKYISNEHILSKEYLEKFETIQKCFSKCDRCDYIVTLLQYCKIFSSWQEFWKILNEGDIKHHTFKKINNTICLELTLNHTNEKKILTPFDLKIIFNEYIRLI